MMMMNITGQYTLSKLYIGPPRRHGWIDDEQPGSLACSAAVRHNSHAPLTPTQPPALQAAGEDLPAPSAAQQPSLEMDNARLRSELANHIAAGCLRDMQVCVWGAAGCAGL